MVATLYCPKQWSWFKPSTWFNPKPSKSCLAYQHALEVVRRDSEGQRLANAFSGEIREATKSERQTFKNRVAHYAHKNNEIVFFTHSSAPGNTTALAHELTHAYLNKARGKHELSNLEEELAAIVTSINITQRSFFKNSNSKPKDINKASDLPNKLQKIAPFPPEQISSDAYEILTQNGFKLPAWVNQM
ncbi:MAG: hypothetical protein VKJ06_03095 [Vampirovibrionales bacterium]|nr:hypothetical protein [Vampirovibrionales bacterium]